MALFHSYALVVLAAVCLNFAEGRLARGLSVHLDNVWDFYKTHHLKSYSSIEERHRRRNWEVNRNRIQTHNTAHAAGLHSFALKENHLADLVDWRERGYRVPVWNQQGCGACYAFSVAAALQAQLLGRTGTLQDLSEQQILDCSAAYGNAGCQGGSLRATMRYLEAAGGIMAERDYPYEGQVGRCRFERVHAVLNISHFELLPVGDEDALARTVASVGPVAASINAKPYTFQFYHRGVYDDPECEATTLNHAVLVVGYTPTEWIVKNWWSERWGEDGFMRVRRGANRCGIANFAVFANITVGSG